MPDATAPTVPTPRESWRDRSGVTRPLKIIAVILGTLFLAWLVLYVTKGRFLKSSFVSIANRVTERQVRVGGDFNLYLNPFHIQFLAEDIAVSNPAWARDRQLFTARKVDLQLNIWRLLFGQRRFNYVDIVNGRGGLERDLNGRNTWTFDGSSDEPFELPDIRRAAITGTVVRYLDRPLELDTTIRVGDVAAAETRFQDRIPFSGTGTSHGAPFRVSGALTSPNATIAGGRNALTMRVDVGRTRIDVAGELRSAFELEGSDLTIRSRGGNLNEAFTLLGVVVPDTRRYDIRSNLTLAGEEWRFTRMNGRFGDSDLAGRMTISQPNERLMIAADLSSRSLDILDAGPWIGYSPERLDAQGGKGAIRQEGGRPRVLPDSPLASESLARFDARVNYEAAAVRTGTIPISGLTVALGLDNKLLTLKPVAFDVAGGRLTANIDLNARKSPVVTDYDIRLTPVQLRRLLTGFDIEDSGTTGTIRARIQLRGTGDTVHESLGSSTGRIAVVLPRGTFWIRNTELLELDAFQYVGKALLKQLKEPSDIRCGLLGFTVANGVARADPVFIDTERSVIRGTGGFSFRDESMNLSILADSKKFSLFSGQSPIAVGGYFAAPTINPISKQLLTRAGAGLALGLAAGPLGAILAFVDLGDEDDTNCAPVLAGARGSRVKAADEAAEEN